MTPSHTMTTPVREGETIEGSRTMRNRRAYPSATVQQPPLLFSFEVANLNVRLLATNQKRETRLEREAVQTIRGVRCPDTLTLTLRFHASTK